MTPEERAKKLFVASDAVVMGDPGGYGPSEDEVLAEIRAAVAEERKACEQIADDWHCKTDNGCPGGIAAAIRARGPSTL